MLIVYGLLAVQRNITSWKQREVQEGSTPEKRMTTKLIYYNHNKIRCFAIFMHTASMKVLQPFSLWWSSKKDYY